MKRTQLGDVYAIKVPNGYKIIQWAYSIPKKGDYIRVFKGLYDCIPEKIEELVMCPHSYIIYLDIKRAYRIGLAQRLGCYVIPGQYPFPKYQMRFDINHETKKVEAIHVMNSDFARDVNKWYDVGSVKELPKRFNDTTLLNCSISPSWLMYLFDVGFDLEHPERFSLGIDPELTIQKYEEILQSFLSAPKTG